MGLIFAAICSMYGVFKDHLTMDRAMSVFYQQNGGQNPVFDSFIWDFVIFPTHVIMFGSCAIAGC